MKTRARSLLLLIGACILLLVISLAWLRAPASAAPAGPAALTLGQKAAIQAVEQLLLNGNQDQMVFLPRIAR
jgi:hypothetical protein